MDRVKLPQGHRLSSLVFTTKFPDILGTHLIDLGGMKVSIDIGATRWSERRTPRLEIQHLGNPARINTNEPLLFSKS